MASRFSARCALSPLLCLPPRRGLLPGFCCPPSPFESRGFRRSPLGARFFSFFLLPRCLWLSLVSGPGCLGPWRCVLFVFFAPRFPARCALLPLFCLLPGRGLLPGVCCPPPLWCLAVFVAASRRSAFFFAPPLSMAFAGFPPRVPWALALCALCFFSFAFRFSACCALLPLSCLPPGRGLLTGVCCPPPPFVSRGFRRCLSALGFFSFRCAPPLSLFSSGFRPRVPWAFALCVGCSPRGWLWCPVYCFVLRRVPFSCGLWCVLCCTSCCVVCFRLVGFLRRVVLGLVVLFLLCFAVLRCCLFCRFFSFFLLSFRGAPGPFGSCALLVRCGARVPAALLSVCCSLCVALWPLRRWLVFCVVVCCAVGPGCPLLSPGGSWWVLVSCFGGVLWCAPGCCAAPCCCVSCCLVLCCCALCCFILLCLVLSRAVSCPGALSVVLWSCAFGAVFCLVSPRCVCFCCVVLLPGVVCRCALCRACPGVSCCAFPVPSALCGVAVRPCSTLVPCFPVLCPVVLCCRVVLWCPVLLPCLFGFSSL